MNLIKFILYKVFVPSVIKRLKEFKHYQMINNIIRDDKFKAYSNYNGKFSHLPDISEFKILKKYKPRKVSAHDAELLRKRHNSQNDINKIITL